MSVPPVPPRPYDSYDRNNSLPPPLPPLPPDLRPSENNNNNNRYTYESPPHFDNPLAAPRPQKLDPALPANMARTLDDQAGMYQDYRRPSPAPPPPQGAGVNYTPGFAFPNPQTNQGHPLPPPQGAGWTPWNAPQNPINPPQTYSSPPPINGPLPYPSSTQPYQPPVHNPDSLAQGMASLSFASNQPPQQQHQPTRAPSLSMHPNAPPPKAPSPPRQAGVPSLTAPLPTIQALSSALGSVQQPNHDPTLKIAWCRDVLFLVDRTQQNASTDTPVGPVVIQDPVLLRLSQTAVPVVLQLASPQPPPNPLPAHVTEAIYLRATFAASGAYPDHVRHNPRSAFRDFEAAARGGYAAAWFRLGRDYENFNDVAHARDCFERGVKLGVESCAYRMGMAHLMGQLGLPAKPELALPLLHRAATLASLEVPQPAYVYGLLLLNEFSHITIPPSLFPPYIPPSSTPAHEARKHLERAAYLNFAPAQYKLGHAYEFAQPPFPFDALLSVQYYSLASQQGEVEADMALSKWFLCGAEGAFEKDEGLAFTFAEKAARKGLPSAEFAMGYYAEVGVGGTKDIDQAIKWYTRASEHGNADASERLSALSQPSPQALSRQEHDTITENKLVRKRTQAKQRSDASPQVAPGPGGRPGPGQGRQVIEVIRKNSLMYNPIPENGQGQGQGQRLPSMPEHPYPGPGPSQPPPQQPQHQPQPQQGQPQQGPGPQGQGRPESNINPNSGSPRLRPASGPGAGPGRQFANTNRYTLTDPGLGSASGSPPGGRPVSGSPPRGGGRPQSQPQGQGRPGPGGRVHSGTMPPASTGPPQEEYEPPRRVATGKGPATFAEMGFQGAKAEEKDCVIM